MHKIIDGQAVAATVRAELTKEIGILKDEGCTPCVAVILVGDRKDSSTYVRMKIKACEETGVKSVVENMPASSSEDEILAIVNEFNRDPSVHGILVQMPLPDKVDSKKVLNAIDPAKDVDGFHPVHVGNLSLRGNKPDFVACTPLGCMELLKRYHVPVEGKNVVVVGRSNTVGLPLALLLLNANATVTVCHSKTANIQEVVKSADIIFAAVGKAHMIKRDWVKEGTVVIDVGINSVDDPSKKTGYRLVGDVDFDEVVKVASKITPVPGGVGPMTVAMLLRNTVDSAKRFHAKNKSKAQS